MRRTIATTISKHGIGLHSGIQCSATLKSSTKTGWILNGHAVQNMPILSGRLATVLGAGEEQVSTVEHLFAALYAHGIDDVLIDIAGGEVPILDGSAAQWYRAIIPKATSLPVHACAPEEPIHLEANGSSLHLYPAADFSARVHVVFDGYDAQSFDGSLADFTKAMTARTFGYADQLSALQQHGYAKGACAENVLGLSKTIPNPIVQPKMTDSELARHKWLDLIGDVSLIGCRLNARIEAYKAGHTLHHELVEKLRELSL